MKVAALLGRKKTATLSLPLPVIVVSLSVVEVDALQRIAIASLSLVEEDDDIMEDRSIYKQ